MSYENGHIERGVIFVCLGNSCRSPMAEGFAKYYGDGSLRVSSAGITPAYAVHPHSVRVMGERGVDISSHEPRHIERFDLGDFDVLVRMGDNVPLPGIEGPRLVEWKVVDPISGDLDFYRTIRDEIDDRVKNLLDYRSDK